jgi:Protein of unknown function (DUF3631)
LNENEEARGIINSGHTRDAAFVVRVEGDEREPMMFSTWGFKAISGIGKRAATIEDRSIKISLKRKAKGEKVERLRHADPAIFNEAASKLARFAQDNMTAFSRARPTLPEALNDRAQDNWEHLLAIADIAGGHWPEIAKRAALGLNGAEDDEPSQAIMLLADIRTVFAIKGVKDIASADLVTALVAMRDRPWEECNHGKALTQNLLARKLKSFEIQPGNVGPKKDRAKGYKAEWFTDAFNRYLPPSATGHPYTPNEINELDENQTVRQANWGTDENSPSPLNSNEVYGGTDEEPPFGDERESGGDFGSEKRKNRTLL